MMNAVQGGASVPRLAISAPDPNSRCKAKPTREERCERDAGGRPHRRNLFGHERQPKANRRRDDIRRYDSDVEPDGATERDRRPRT
jgi:hypothetical protein